MNRRMLLQKHFHDIGFMDTRAVPDENERSADMPSDMFQSYNQFLGILRSDQGRHGQGVAADRQSHHGRGLPAIFCDPLELGGLAFWRPSKAHGFGIGQTKLIFKNDLGAEPLRFFLSLANPFSTRSVSALHRARWRADPAFGHSSPGHAATG